MIAYFDTSALAKKVFREDGAELADQVWDAASVTVSSELVYPEARAAAALARRARRVTDGQLRRAVDEIERLCAALDVLSVDRDTARAAGELAEAHDLRAYDAVHLAAAIALPARRVVMVTWDKDLARACTANGIGVIPAHQQPVRPGDLALR